MNKCETCKCLVVTKSLQEFLFEGVVTKEADERILYLELSDGHVSFSTPDILYTHFTKET